MRCRNVVLLLTFAFSVSGCEFMGQAAVHVETGNQQSGYLSRPLQMTASSDESVEQVAQRICSNVKPDSIAKITFVGKVPGPGPLDFADWGRYRYDCEVHPTATPARAAVAADPASPVPPGGSSAGVQGDEQHQRECQHQQGTYELCLGGCMLNSNSPTGQVEGECRQRCATKLPAGCG